MMGTEAALLSLLLALAAPVASFPDSGGGLFPSQGLWWEGVGGEEGGEGWERRRGGGGLARGG